jgi:hypothetical protein
VTYRTDLLEARRVRAEARSLRRHERQVRGYQAARKLTCTACKRGNALGKAHTSTDYRDGAPITSRKCRYCGAWQAQA